MTDPINFIHNSDSHNNDDHNDQADNYQVGGDSMERAKFELVSAYIDGEVTAAERRQVEDLLASDPVTKHLYQRLLNLHNEIRYIPMPASVPVEDIVDQVFQKIDEKQARRNIWRGGAIAAVFVAIATSVIGQTFMPEMAKRPKPESVQVAVNEPVIEIVKPDDLILTIDQPLVEIPVVEKADDQKEVE